MRAFRIHMWRVWHICGHSFPELLFLMCQNICILCIQIFDLKSQNPQLFNTLPSSLRKMAARLLDQSSILRMFNAGSLNVSKDADLSLLGELQLIKEVVSTVSCWAECCSSGEVCGFASQGASDSWGYDSHLRQKRLRVFSDIWLAYLLPTKNVVHVHLTLAG